MLYSKSLKQVNNAPTIRIYIEGKTLLGIKQVCIPRGGNDIFRNGPTRLFLSGWLLNFNCQSYPATLSTYNNNR